MMNIGFFYIVTLYLKNVSFCRMLTKQDSKFALLKKVVPTYVLHLTLIGNIKIPRKFTHSKRPSIMTLTKNLFPNSAAPLKEIKVAVRVNFFVNFM